MSLKYEPASGIAAHFCKVVVLTLIPWRSSTTQHADVERRENTLKDFRDFQLKAKARSWP